MHLGEISSAMETWGEIIVTWTSLRLVKLAETATSVSVWEYVSLALFFTSIWLYRILEFHFVEDLLHGFRGEVPRLHHSSASKIAAHILPKCKILKQRYWATPWLCSPHLQTAFLHFNGHPPPIKYHRQLYITPDKGTIALDWVKPPLSNDKDDSDHDQQSPELDKTPVVLIIPGLTSDSEDPYLKHIAYSSAKKGWRTLVCNHRGLGGVSITSDQFYNAGWTEDLRRIINYVHGKYPLAPLFTIGTSMGANILVKYLGEEGASTPVGAAAAVCDPWDLMVCDRFMSRNGVQRLYNRVLAFGLLQYATQHQTVLDRIADWDHLAKSKTIRDFDHHCTRHTGNYETVDTYYRRCSSADFLAKVAVPLLCFSTLDDPVCTKEAIPWDEIMANPNVVMTITKHGGHLAYFEGLTARTIWWERALIEYMAVMIPSNLMHTPAKVPALNRRNRQDSDVDKAPYLNVSRSGQVAAEDLQPSSPANTGQEDSVDERDVIYEREPTMEEKVQSEHVLTSREIGAEDEPVGDATVTLSLRDSSELTALQSALSQLLQQLQDLPSAIQEYKHESPIHSPNEDYHDMRPGSPASETLSVHSKQSTVLALQESSLRAVEVPISLSVMSPLRNCREAARSLMSSCNKTSPMDSKPGSEDSVRRNFSDQTRQQKGTQQGHGKRRLEPRDAHAKGFAGVAAQKRRTLWLLTYVALVTTCPLIGSALFFRWRGKFTNFSRRLLK